MLLKSVLLLLIISLVLLNESDAKRSGGRSRISATLFNRNNKKRKGSSSRNKSKENLQKEIGSTGVVNPKPKLDDKHVKPLGFDNVNKPSAPPNNQKPIGWNVPDNTNTKTVQKPLNSAPSHTSNGNPPPYSAGNNGNPPPYTAGGVGNPPPYSAGGHGNPPPYSPGGHGNPPPYSTGAHGNPPPYNNNPNHHGNYGNPPPYGTNTNQHPGNQGNPPPYSAYPNQNGQGPPPYNHGFNNNNNQHGYYPNVPQSSYNQYPGKYGGGGFGGMGGFGGNRGFGGGMTKPRGFGAGFGAGFLTTAVSGLLIWNLMRAGSSQRYGVYNHYNRPDDTLEDIKLPANLITTCDDNVNALCAENTTPLCTSNDTILCVVTMSATKPCGDGSCVTTVDTCNNCTDDKAAENATMSLPCIANATVFGNVNPVGSTPVNASLSVFDPNSNNTVYCVTTMAMPYTEPLVFPTDAPMINGTEFEMEGNDDNVTVITTMQPTQV